jgi:hypothetical protein
MVKLEIFVVDNCWSCEESHRIAAEAKQRFADVVEVALRDLERDPHPLTVFAAPTYVLDGDVISLGNPRREELWARLAQRVKESGT